MSRRRDPLVEGVRETGENGLASGERRPHRLRVAEIDGMDGELRVRKRTRVEARDVEPRVGQELRGEATDPAKAKHGDFLEHAPPLAPCRRGCGSQDARAPPSPYSVFSSRSAIHILSSA